jgi:GTP-binding protein HflX
MVTRRGDVAYVIVGDNSHILLPPLGRFRSGPGRLRGLRCIHTHLNREPLSQEDVSDLVLMGLDLMASVQVGKDGTPGSISYAHILPENHKGEGWQVWTVPDSGQLQLDFRELIQSLENELARASSGQRLEEKEKALLVSVSASPAWHAGESLEELKELAISDDLHVVDTVIQPIKRAHPRILMGKGRLRELVLKCLQTGADLLVFDDEITPAQVKHLTDETDLKIIDRSQLILDMFAKRAVTREGKIQVELAQLRYLLPRLSTKNTALSRLTGGIGGRGPGETKLEINRRRVRNRIARLNRELEGIKQQREIQRKLRKARNLPIVSIVGYTNAGKSTLLNNLTQSHTPVENRLFATLDPATRRLRFPKEREVIITDTVGFIRDLPKDLIHAFGATLEQLYDADLMLHVADASNPRMEEQIEAVDRILNQLSLEKIPNLLVLNKTDLLNRQNVEGFSRTHRGIPISAQDPSTFGFLLEEIERLIWSPSSMVGNERFLSQVSAPVEEGARKAWPRHQKE